ncbi:MAG: amino acid adenylation domain-containing protein [Chloroflexota bacterium]
MTQQGTLDKRALLAQLLQQKKNVYQYPLSYGQQALWFINQSVPNNSAYNMAFLLQFEGNLNRASLQNALQALVNRHSSLRATIQFVDGEPMQTVQPTGSYVWVEHDATAWSQEALDTAQRKAYEQPFDLTQAPVLRAELFQTDSDSHNLLLTMHHIFGDATSMSILAQDLLAFYEAEQSGQNAALPAIAANYEDFVRAENAFLDSAEGERLASYWQTQLGKDVPMLDIPTDYARPATQSYQGAAQFFALPTTLSQQLKALAQQEKTTLYSILLTTFQILLHRYTGQDEVWLGSPTSTSRRQPQFENIIGYLVNPVVIAATIESPTTLSFRSLLAQNKTTAVEAIEHAAYPFPLLVRKLQPQRDMSAQPLFQAVLDFQPASGLPPTQEVAGLTVSTPTFSQMEGLFDLTFNMSDGETISGAFRYNTDLFKPETIERMIGHFQKLLTSIIAAPNQAVADLPLLTAAERQQIMGEWNNTTVDYPTNQTIHQRFEEQAAQQPEQIAVIFEGEIVTYAELNQRANQLAHYLRSLGVGPDVLVGVCVERSVEMVVGLYGILKAGGAYVPLDPTYPEDRLAFMVEDADVPVLLTQAHLREGLPATNATIFCLDSDWGDIQTYPQDNPNVSLQPHQLAYMIYTSGSTGRPKGAMNHHQAIYNRLLWMQDEYQLTSADKILQKTPFSFDVSVWEFFWPLMFGAQLVVARPEGHKDPQYLIDIIMQEAITTLHFVPSMLQLFIEATGVSQCVSLKRIICSGEALPYDLMQRCLSRLPAELHNLYGPTEAAIDVSYWACHADYGRQIVPIGRPVANTQLYILDEQLEPVPIGIPGELHLGGVQLARGYHNRPELTAEKFIPNPFGEGRLYKTGDLARWLTDGNIEYIGRTDFQVKLRGFRIELGEIENAIVAQAGVREAVVMAREVQGGDRRLVAYVSPDEKDAYPLQQLLRLTEGENGTDRPYYSMPNGMTVFYQNRTETDFMYREIFADASYLRHGITLQEGACVFDVGANMGMFSLFVHQMCPDATIHAFEPIPSIHELLALNTKLYGVQAHNYHYGLASTAGVDTFTYYPNVSIVSGRFADKTEEQAVVKSFVQHDSSDNLSDAEINELLETRLTSEEITCELKTLSDVIAEQGITQIDLLKVDVEKSEHDILLGIADHDWGKIKQIVVEVHDNQGELATMQQLLEQHGFVCEVEQESMLEDTALYNVYAVHTSLKNSTQDNIHSSTQDDAHSARTQYSDPQQLIQDVKTHIQDSLPEYMVPSAFVFLDTMPLTPNGKVDRKALPEPDVVVRATEYVTPRDPVELRLAQIWEQIVGVSPIGVYDNFFEIGGDSLLAIRLIAKIEQAFGQRIQLQMIFQEGTIEQFARVLRADYVPPAWSPVVCLQPKGDKTPIFFVHPSGGSAFSYHQIAALMGTERPFYAVQPRGTEPGQAFHDSVEEMAADYVKAIYEVQPEGPYLLAGWSFGGLVNIEMARIMEQDGKEAPLVIMIDTPAPYANNMGVEDDVEFLLERLPYFHQQISLDKLDFYNSNEEKVKYMMQEMRIGGLLQPDIDDKDARHWLNLYKHHNQIADLYTPSAPFPGKIVFFTPGEEIPFDVRMGSPEEWADFATNGLEILESAGNHFTMVSPTNTPVLVDHIQACIIRDFLF